MIKPLGVYIIVKKDDQGPLEYGGILIPEGAERTPRFCKTIRGTVIDIGGRVKWVKPGDRVLMQSYAGDEFFHEGEQFTRMREKDLTGFDHE